MAKVERSFSMSALAHAGQSTLSPNARTYFSKRPSQEWHKYS
jgi:hypothetical protein